MDVQVQQPSRTRWAALVLLCVAQFMVILDITVVNVALPEIGADLRLDRAGVTWVMTAYTTAFGGLMLLGGRLADMAGRRRTFLTGLAVFTAASLASGLAPGGGMLVAARAGQGIGAALLSPAALSIITTTFRGTDRYRALGVWAAIGGAGAAVGVLLGGVLAGGPGWQWIFYINVPVGVAAALAAPALVAAGRPDRATRRLDLTGALLVTASMGSLIYGLVRAGEAGWASVSTLVPVAAAAAGVVAFVAVERTVREPLVRLAVLARRNVAGGVVVMLVATGLLLAGFFLSSQYLQRALELGPVRTGLAFLPVAVIIAAGAHLGARLVGRVGPRRVAAAGFGVVTAGAVLLARLPADGNVLTDLLPGFLLLGGGLGAVMVTATTTALAGVAHTEAGLVSGTVNTGHELGAAVGIAVMSTVAATSLGGGPGTVVPVGGFQDAFAVAVVVAAGAALAAPVLLPPGRLPVSDGPVLAH